MVYFPLPTTARKLNRTCISTDHDSREHHPSCWTVEPRELFACAVGMATGCCCSTLIRWPTASQVKEYLFPLLENHWILSGKFYSVHTINYCVGCESRTNQVMVLINKVIQLSLALATFFTNALCGLNDHPFDDVSRALKKLIGKYWKMNKKALETFRPYVDFLSKKDE